MKKSGLLMAVNYLSPVFFFFFCLYEVTNKTPADFLIPIVGRWEVIALWLTLSWLLIGLAILFYRQFRSFMRIPTTVAVSLLLLVAIGFWLRAAVAPYSHRLYYDEDIYLNTGQEIQAAGKALACGGGYVEF